MLATSLSVVDNLARENNDVMANRPLCSVDGCTLEVRARGYCTRHYGRWRYYGDPVKGPAESVGYKRRKSKEL